LISIGAKKIAGKAEQFIRTGGFAGLAAVVLAAYKLAAGRIDLDTLAI
jgi:hypothetical protein